MFYFSVNLLKLLNVKSFQLTNYGLPNLSPGPFTVRNYAARKGTRERKAKILKVLKKKAEDRKAKEARMKETLLIPKVSRRFDDARRPECNDDVCVWRFYKLKTYSFAEAVECHREIHHPTVYNTPDSPLNVFIELDMKAVKKNRYMDAFRRIASVPYEFPHGEERSVLVFCKTDEQIEEALANGASKAGGVQLVKEIEKGEVSLKEYEHVVAHPNILPELVPVRGLLKRRFPNIQEGTLSMNIKEMLWKYIKGIRYSAEKDQYELDYASIETPIGKLNMETAHLHANLEGLLTDIYKMKPKRPGPFFTSMFLKCPPSVEQFKLDVAEFLPELKEEQEQKFEIESDDDDDDDDDEEKKAAGS